MSEVLLITGGASGIGAAVARLASRKGYDIAINYRTRKQEAQLLVEELSEAGIHAIAVQADISIPEDIERLYHEVDEKLGPVTALVNSAGIGTGPTRVDAADAARLGERLGSGPGRLGQSNGALCRNRQQRSFHEHQRRHILELGHQ